MLIFANILSEIGDYVAGFLGSNDGRNGW